MTTLKIINVIKFVIVLGMTTAIVGCLLTLLGLVIALIKGEEDE